MRVLVHGEVLADGEKKKKGLNVLSALCWILRSIYIRLGNHKKVKHTNHLITGDSLLHEAFIAN